jgi:ATP-dependent Clp protease ATP-binding subunit ClpC
MAGKRVFYIMLDNFENFDKGALQIMRYAQEEAARLGHNYIGTEHILLAILRDENNFAAQMLHALNLDYRQILSAVEFVVKTGDKPTKGQIPLAARSKKIISLATEAAQEFGADYIGAEHLLLGMLNEKDNLAIGILENQGVDTDALRQNLSEKMRLPTDSGGKYQFEKLSMSGDELEEMLMQVSRGKSDIEPFVPGAEPTQESAEDLEARERAKDLPTGFKQSLLSHLETLFKEIEQVIRTGGGKPVPDSELNPFLTLGVSLVDQARADEFDPLIGRERETERLLTILNRRENGHALLVGESGVGKAAIVKWIAQGVATLENVGSDIIWVQHGRLVELLLNPGRAQDLTARLTQPIILCIREIDRIAEFAGKESRFAALHDLASHPFVRLIGTTTPDGYEKLRSLEPVLSRRFQVVRVDEPDAIDTFQILLGLKARYEKHHNVEIEEAALQRAILFSELFVTDRVLPAKALELLDEACSLVALRSTARQEAKTVTAVHLTELIMEMTGKSAEEIDAELGEHEF